MESLIGKGCDLRILDENVSIARLGGANQRYIEEEIPHVASLMCSTLGSLLEHAEVVVLGNAGQTATDAVAALGRQHILVDLVRSFAGESPSPGARPAQ